MKRSTLFVALLLAGCKDIYADPFASVVDAGRAPRPSGGAAGSSGASAGGGTGEIRPTSNCPEERPYDGVSCPSGSGGACEYGSNVDGRCNTKVECNDAGTWSTLHEPPTCDPCPTEDRVVEGTPCGDEATSDAGAEALDGGSAIVNETLCAYPTRTCACTLSGGRQQWVCSATPTDCPATRPLEGQACTVEQTCSYGGCISPLGLTMTCTGRYWAIAKIQCN